MKKIKCPYCDTENSRESSYCCGCGSRLDKDAIEAEEKEEELKSILDEDKEDNEGYASIATKFQTPAFLSAFLIIFFSIFAIGGSIPAISMIKSVKDSFGFYNMEFIIFPIIWIVVAAGILIYIIYKNRIEKNAPLTIISYNQEKHEFKVYTNSGFVKIDKEKILNVEIRISTSRRTGGSFVMVQSTAGVLSFILKDGTRVNSINASTVTEAYAKIKAIIQ